MKNKNIKKADPLFKKVLFSLRAKILLYPFLFVLVVTVIYSINFYIYYDYENKLSNRIFANIYKLVIWKWIIYMLYSYIVILTYGIKDMLKKPRFSITWKSWDYKVKEFFVIANIISFVFITSSFIIACCTQSYQKRFGLSIYFLSVMSGQIAMFFGSNSAAVSNIINLNLINLGSGHKQINSLEWFDNTGEATSRLIEQISNFAIGIN